MKIIKVRMIDSFNANSAYRFFLKIGLKGTTTLPKVKERINDYVFYETRTYKRRAQEVTKIFGHFDNYIYHNEIFSGLDVDDLKKIFLAMESTMPKKIRTSFTLGLNEVVIK